MAHCNIYAANHRVLLENRYVLKKKVLASCKALAMTAALDPRPKSPQKRPNLWSGVLTGSAANH